MEAAADAAARARSAIRASLDAGAPWQACDIFHEAHAHHAGDAELLYWGALAHARAGAASEAHALIERALASADLAPSLRVEILSLRGRLLKDGLHRSGTAADHAQLAERARDQYMAAYAISH